MVGWSPGTLIVAAMVADVPTNASDRPATTAAMRCMMFLSHKVAAGAEKHPLQQIGPARAMEILHFRAVAAFLGGRRGAQTSIPPTTTPP
jgi:hypothetical protein